MASPGDLLNALEEIYQLSAKALGYRTAEDEECAEYSRIPKRIMGGLHRYIDHFIQPGDFMTAVLGNNLKEAMGRADIECRGALFHIVSYLYNEAPSAAWGTPERVNEWLSQRSEETDAACRDCEACKRF